MGSRVMNWLRGSKLRSVGRICGIVAVALCMQAQGYEGTFHQKLTFLAAKQFNRCVNGTGVPHVTPLQVRYIARSNVRQANTNVFVRMFNWSYYDRGGQDERSLLWLIDTRFHEHFNEVLEGLAGADDAVERNRGFGRIVNYVQDVTSPAHSVPVYTARFWRFNLADRFDSYPVDEQAVQEALTDSCNHLNSQTDDYVEILRDAAADTIRAVKAPMTGMPVSWEAFWKPDDDEDAFGEYGPAGNNFGRKSEFRCGEEERCVLLNDDPLYADFAVQRHVAAVLGTMRVMMVLQGENLPVVAEE